MTNTRLDIDWLREQGAEPHWFGLGFIQLKLNSAERLHFYPSHPDYCAFVGAEEIHDHRYDFASHVLQGSITQTVFDYEVGDGSYEMVCVSCDPNDPAPEIDPINVRVTQIASMTLPTGGNYWLDADSFHTFRGHDNAITVLTRAPTRKTFARVLRPLGSESICAFSRPKLVTELWDMIESMLPPRPGYHLTPIAKGVVGEASKVLEEAQEFIDAVDQGVSIMALVELADLVGAAESYLAKHHPTMTLDDLKSMSAVTRRAFENGKR